MNVLLQGGLCNQMFQFAFGRSLSLRHGVPLTFDRSYIDTDKKRPYRLDRYLDVDFAPSTGLPVYREKGCPYDPAALTANPNSPFIGYWQTEKYFNVEEVRKAFARAARRTRQLLTLYLVLTKIRASFTPAADAIVMAMEKYDGGEPINIGSGTEISIKDLVNEVSHAVGYEGDVVYDSGKPNGQPRRRLDVSRAKEAFGWESRTPLGEGLKKTVGWYLQQCV
jgi:hypothetical protein